MTKEQELFELVNNTVITANAAILKAVSDRSADLFELSIRMHRIIEQYDIYCYYYKQNPTDPALTKIAARIPNLVKKVLEKV
jgi:hypothetical protein